MAKKRTVFGDEEKEEMAANVVVVTNGLIKLPTAMKQVGFDMPANDTVRRRIQRLITKKTKEREGREGEGGSAVRSGAALLVGLSASTSVSTLTSTNSDPLDSLVDRLFDEGAAAASPTVGVSTVASLPKKHRRSSKAKHQDDANIAKRKRN